MIPWLDYLYGGNNSQGGILGYPSLETDPQGGWGIASTASSAPPAAAGPAQAATPQPPPPLARPQPSRPVAPPLDIKLGAAAPAAMLPNNGGVGREADQSNPLTTLLGGMGNDFTGLLGPGTPQNPNLLDRLTAGATNLTTGGNPIAGVLNAVNGLATGQRTDRAGVALAQQQATMRALMNAGVDSVTARAAAINPDYLKALMMARLAAKPAPQQARPAQRQAQQPARYAPGLANPTAPGTLSLYVDENGQYQIAPHR